VSLVGEPPFSNSKLMIEEGHRKEGLGVLSDQVNIHEKGK
jgi:hypothetical protein